MPSPIPSFRELARVERVQRETDVARLREMAVMLARENRRPVAKVVELTKKLATATGLDKAQLELELANLHKPLARSPPKNEGRKQPKEERKGRGREADG